MYLKAGVSLEVSYKDILKEIVNYGSKRQTRGTTSLELSPFVWSTSYPLRNVLSNPVRKINKAYAVIELLWILSGRTDLEMLEPYNSNISQFSDNGLSFHGAYGPKFCHQLTYVIEKLRADLSSRQAIISIWERRPSESKDIPCTLSFQFLSNGKELDLIVTMRSNDAWLGFPYDVFTFTNIQSFVACKLKLLVGQYTHQAGSEHLYIDRLDLAKAAFKKEETTVGELVETESITKDELTQTILIEQQLRRFYLNHDVRQLRLVSREAAKLSEPWQSWVKMLSCHLLKKIK